MLVGVPKETKDNEYRIGLVPSTVRELADKGHRVLVEATRTIARPAPRSLRTPMPYLAAPS
jgi:alanine dehydrogenase